MAAWPSDLGMRWLGLAVLVVACGGGEFDSRTLAEPDAGSGSGGADTDMMAGAGGEPTDAGTPDAHRVYPCEIGTACTTSTGNGACLGADAYTPLSEQCGGPSSGLACVIASISGGLAYTCQPLCSHDYECESGCCGREQAEGLGRRACMQVGYSDQSINCAGN